MADVIEQDTLVEIKGRRPTKLPEVFVRPALDGKRLPGEVEIHQNGLRYQSPMGSQKIGKFGERAASTEFAHEFRQIYCSVTSSTYSSSRVTTSFLSSSTST